MNNVKRILLLMGGDNDRGHIYCLTGNLHHIFEK